MTEKQREAIWQDLGRPQEGDRWEGIITGDRIYVANLSSFERQLQAGDDEQDLIRLGSDFQ